LEIQKTRGNAQLISEGDAIVFESEDDIDLIKIEMSRVKKELSTHQNKKKEQTTSIQNWI